MKTMKIGERLLTATIDHVAETDPEKICFSVPVASSPVECLDISYKRFANSINRLSSWLKQNIGLSDKCDTICYLGPPDLLYFIFALAACKCGYKALFTSPRNSIEAHVNLLDLTDCHTLIGPKSTAVSAILKQHSIDHKVIEPLEHWLDEAPVKHFQHQKSFNDLAKEPFVVLHTSGTTGLPKPVNITHGLVSIVDNFQHLPSIDNKDLWIKQLKNKRIYCCLPPFHSAGTNFLIFCIFFGAILVLPPASQPPDLNLIETILDHGLASAGCMAPSILEEMAGSSSLEKLRAWDFVAFGGSPLSKTAGDKLWNVTKVLNLLGTTETYVLPELEPEAKDEWQYHAFHPSLGLKFEERSAGRFEAVFRRTKESERFQGCFQTFPEKDTYATSDLYSKHPSKPGLWLYGGRVDDIVVLSNGEKFNPQDLETIVAAHPDVKAVITIGNGRTQPALLIEPEASLARLQPESRQIDQVWEAVAEANDALPKHAQIDKQHIAILPPDEPLPRSSKGAVQRQPALEQKQDLIEDLYVSAESKESHSIDLDFQSLDSLKDSLLEGIQLSSKSLDGIEPDSNLFKSGMDSLQAVQLARTIRSGLESVPDLSEDLPDQFPKPALIYKCPTVELLAQALMNAAKGGSLPQTPDSEHDDTLTAMEEARKRYAHEQKPFQISTKASSEAKVVVLTGSTGRLGSYLLHSLLSDNDVKKIYCLGRTPAKELHDRQVKSQQEKGLTGDFDRVEFHQFDVEQESWGLPKDLVSQLSQSTTHIIHNAWPVDFNHSFDTFRGQLLGCQRLMQLASQCCHLQNLFFVSSVGAANRYQNEERSEVPEEIIEDMLAGESMGYAQSKLVAELLLTDAARKSGLPATVCRVGQIAGPIKQDTGCWNRDEWFPSLVISSKSMGKIPKSLGAMDDIDWLPSDILGDVLIQLAFSDTKSSEARVLHAVNPRRVRWLTLLDELQKSSHFENIEAVEFADWVASLRDMSNDESVTLDTIPAVKLLDFYEALIEDKSRPVYSTTKSTECSEALQGISHIQAEWLEKWIGQWFNA